MSEKKQLVLDAFNNKPTKRVPIGFWFHYTADELQSSMIFLKCVRRTSADTIALFLLLSRILSN